MNGQTRWPAGTPVAPTGRGPGGGRFRGGSWAARLVSRGDPLDIANPLRPGMSRTELLALRESYETDAEAHHTRLHGGSTAVTRRLEFEDGGRVISKKMGKQRDLHGEYLGNLLAQAIAAPAPALIIVSDDLDKELWVGWVPGHTGDEMGVSKEALRDLPIMSESNHPVRIGLLDILTFNTDRHGGNFVFDESDGDLGEVFAIDQGRSWWFLPDHPDRPQWLESYFVGHPMAELWFDEDKDGNTVWADALLPDEARQIGDRLRSLRPEFERLGHLDWYALTMDTWDSIAKAQT